MPVDAVGGIVSTEIRKVHAEMLNETTVPASVSALPSRQSAPPAHLRRSESGAHNPRRSRVRILADDARARHLRETVGLVVGGTFHVGVEGGLRGIATIAALTPRLSFSVAWEKSAQARLPLTVLVGLPRPQTAKKLLHDLASLGAARIVFFEAEKGDPGYLTSSLWKDGEWREHVLKGTEQACSTLVPEVSRVPSLAEAVARVDANAWKLALDPYEATGAPELSSPAKSAVLADRPGARLRRKRTRDAARRRLRVRAPRRPHPARRSRGARRRRAHARAAARMGEAPPGRRLITPPPCGRAPEAAGWPLPLPMTLRSFQPSGTGTSKPPGASRITRTCAPSSA
jgi:RsmE family RNA methyltransferase